MIRLSSVFTLPLDTAASQKYAFLGRSGAGKSYAAGKLVEELLSSGVQVVVVDPVGVWYGLRLAANGKDAGLEIPILGGPHGDYPLEASAGAVIADFITDTGASVVLDVSEMTGVETRRFVADFATHLLQRKKRQRSPLLVVWEEAQEFVPQRVFADAAKMVGSMERLVKIGRNFGIGTVLISQRPQAVNKDVLNQTEVLFVYQLTGPQERKAIEGWIVDKALDLGNVIDELPSLPTGTGYVWSPQWLKVFKKIRVDAKRTFDASSTPTHNAEGQAATKLTPIDLELLQTAMAATIEKAKGEDPKELRRRIAELEKQLRAKPQEAAPEPVRVEVPAVGDDQIERLSQALGNVDAAIAKLSDMAQSIRESLARVSAKPERKPIPMKQSAPRLPDIADPVKNVDGINGPQQRILDALAELESLGITEAAKSNVAVFADQSPKSSGYTNNLGRLRTMGFIEYPRSGTVCLSDAGRSVASRSLNIRTLSDLHSAWFVKLSSPRVAILKVLIQCYPQAMEKTELAESAGASPKSSGYTNNLGGLRTLGLIDYPDSGCVAATELLFPEGLK
jgi:Mn-dependent DtxR family transcriptional regulator